MATSDPPPPNPSVGREAYPGADAVNRLVDEYRDRCLWFLRGDYYPESAEQALRVLGHIERHGDRTAYRRAGEVRQWLSRSSSAGSAAS